MSALIRRSRRNRVFLPAVFGSGGRLSGLVNRMGRMRSTARSARLGASRSSTTTRTRTQGNVSGIGVTTQRDSKFVYAKRRMPRRRRNNWKRFGRKVHAISERELGSRTVVRNVTYAHSNSVAGNHIVATAYLYPQRGTANIADDLFQIGGLENIADPTAAAGSSLSPSTKFLFQSAVLDLTIRNTSGYRDNGNPALIVPSSDLKLELDVYEVSVGTSTEETGFTFVDLVALFQDNATRTGPIGGTGTEIDIVARGVTPWDTTYALSRWRIRIWKKTKYLIPNGDVITYQVRDPRRHVSNMRDVQARDGFNRPGWTRCIFMIGKVVPGLTVGTAGNEVLERITIGSTRKYMYKVEGVNEDRTRVV